MSFLINLLIKFFPNKLLRYPSFRLDSTYPPNKVWPSIKSAKAYRKLIQALGPHYNIGVKVISFFGGIEVENFDAKPSIFERMINKPRMITLPIIPDRDHPTSQLKQTFDYLHKYFDKIEYTLGYYYPNKNIIHIHPESVVFDCLVISMDHKVHIDRLKPMIKKAMINTIIEELAHSYQPRSFSWRHFTQGYSSKNNLQLAKYLIFIGLFGMFLFFQFVMTENTPLRTWSPYLFTLAAMYIAHQINKRKDKETEEKIYNHDPFEIEAKTKAADPHIRKLANEAFEIHINLSDKDLVQLHRFIVENY